jgi:hypothetical protein
MVGASTTRQELPMLRRIGLLCALFTGLPASHAAAQSPLPPGSYQFKIAATSVQSYAGSWQLYTSGGPQSPSAFTGFAPEGSVEFVTDIDPGDVSMTFGTDSQVLVWINGGWVPFSAASLRNVTMDWIRGTVEGAEPGMPDGTASWTVIPYGQRGYVQSIYPAGTTLADLVRTSIGMTATKPDWGYPYPDNKVVLWSAGIFGGFTIPQPKLTVFLDADGFSAADPAGTDDKSWFVPGSLHTGVSVAPSALPQRIHVAAAYLDYAGAVVAPPVAGSATMSLSHVSAFKGIAMNASMRHRSDDAPDVEAVTTTAAFASTDNVARFDLDVYDYGAIATATVTHGSGPSQSTAQLRIPLDADGNALPDAGWLASDSTQGVTTTLHVAGTGASADDTDPGPAGTTAVGDGLTRYEEYRGFLVQGTHVRTNPGVMDLFINYQNTLSLGFAANLPFSKWGVLATEIDTDRGINFKFTDAAVPLPGHFAQKALQLVDGGYNRASPGTVGYTNSVTNNPAPPSQIVSITIYTGSIRWSSPPHNSKTRKDPVDPEKTSQTIAHEVGHGISLQHIPVNGACPLPPATDTVMVTLYFSQTTNVNDCAWTHIPHLYLVSDLVFLALR